MALLTALLFILSPFLQVRIKREEGKLKVTSIYFGFGINKKNSNHKD